MTILPLRNTPTTTMYDAMSQVGPSSDVVMTEEDPLRRKRRALQSQQAELDDIRQTIVQLQSLTDDDHDMANKASTSQWKLGGGDTIATAQVGEVSSQIRNGQVLVPLDKVAFVKGQVIGDTPNSSKRSTVWLDINSKLAKSIGKTANAHDGKVEVSVESLLSQLKVQRMALERALNAQRQEVMKMASEYYSKHVGESLGVDNVELDEQGQAVNEEGLPFIDLTEAVSQEEKKNGRGVVLPFKPEAKSKDERRRLIESILDNLQDEEGGDLGGEGDEGAMAESGESQSLQSNSRPTSHGLHKRVASADRPAPVKSVLKHTSHPSSGTSTPQRFGASGFRKGFLNMNPSSPGAEHSSDPIEKILWKSDDPMSASTSSFGSMADHVRGADGGGNSSSGGEDRMSRSTELQPAKKKKTVRIQSPAAQRRHPPPTDVHERFTGPLAQTKGSVSNQGDENVEEEAKQIVNLLGIDAIKGHPQYDTIKAGMDAENSAQSSHAPASLPPAKRKASEGPAIRKDVVERSSSQPSSSSTSSAPRSSSGKPVSAFKRGFLAKPVQRPPMPPVPTAPQQSQGISALERAAKSDSSLSKERLRRGLPPSVPHARPSKAFAERLKARERGTDVDATRDEEEDEGVAKMSKVRFSEKGDGQVAVKVGTAATEASERERMSVVPLKEEEEEERSSGDEEMAAMGLEIREEELDDDEVEALGFFSDEEMDPDIGFDSDDLVEAAPPRFDSDAGDIDNEDLRREYERMKASLQQKNGLVPNRYAAHGFDQDDDDLMHITQAGQDLSLADDGEDDREKANVSRFRRERLYRALMNRPAVSRELGKERRQGLQNAHDVDSSSMQNVGPSMLIPALANVRYPKPRADGTVPVTANEIELDGESDGEEDRLEDLMRARLDEAQLLSEHAARAASVHGQSATVNPSDTAERQPPAIGRSTGKSDKKPSLFKSRKQTGQE